MKKRYPIHKILSLVLVALFLLNMVPNVAFASLRLRGERTKAEQSIDVGEAKELKAYLEKKDYVDPNPENPDPENPDPENPDPENPDPDSSNASYEYHVYLVLDGTTLAGDALNDVTVYWGNNNVQKSGAEGYVTEADEVSAKVHYDGLILALNEENTEEKALTVSADANNVDNVFVGGEAEVRIETNVTFDDASKSLLSKTTDDGITVNTVDKKVAATANVKAGTYNAVIYIQGESETIYAKKEITIKVQDRVVYQIGDGEDGTIYTNGGTIRVTATVYEENATLSTITLSKKNGTTVRTEQFGRNPQVIDGKTVYTKEVPLKTRQSRELDEGEYKLSVGGLERIVVIDRTGPVVKLTAPMVADGGINTEKHNIYLAAGEDGKVVIHVSVEDVAINKENIDEAVEKNYEDNQVSNVDLTDWSELKDQAGNKTSEIVYMDGSTEYTLQTEESGKTIYSLKVDRLAPYSNAESKVIVLNTNPDGEYFNQETITVYGTIVDPDVGLDKVTYTVSGTAVETVDESNVTVDENNQFVIEVKTLKDSVGEATVKVVAEDKAGNVRSAEKTLQIDRVLPDVTIKMPCNLEGNTPVKSIDGVDYYETEQEIIVIVKDDNFNPLSTVEVTVDGETKPVEFSGDKWVPDGDVYKMTIKVSDQQDEENSVDIVTAMAITGVSVKALDKAENEKDANQAYSFKVDTQSPTVTITAENCSVYKNNDKIFLVPSVHADNSGNGDVLVDDEVNATVKLKMEFSDANINLEEIFGSVVLPDGESVTIEENNVKKTATYTISCKPGEIKLIQLPAIFDTMGNPLRAATLIPGRQSDESNTTQSETLTIITDEESEDYGKIEPLYVDLQTPTFVEQGDGETKVVVKDLSEGIVNNLHTGDLAFEVRVDDGDYGTGINSVDYKTSESEAIEQNYYEFIPATFADDVYTANITTEDKEDNTVYLYFQVTDHAGNVRTYEYGPIAVDRKAPAVDITLPENTENAESPVYFNKAQNIFITASDINFAPDNSTVVVTMSDNNTKYEFSGERWVYDKDNGNYVVTLTVSDENADIITVAENGAGLAVTNVSVEAKDLAYVEKTEETGETEETNIASKRVSCSFIVDTKAPEIEIKLPGTPDNTFGETAYYKKAQKIVVTVIDANLDKDSSVTVTMSDGTKYEFSGEDRWKSDGNKHTLTISVSDKDADIITAKDGAGLAVAEVTVAAKDLATNEGVRTENCSFIVDVTAPVVDVTLPKKPVNKTDDTDYYNENQQIVITVTDRNLDTTSTVVVTMSDGEKHTFSGDRWVISGDQNVMILSVSDQKGDILTIKNNEGLAVTNVTVNAKDLATNAGPRSESCSFIVDTIIPTITAVFSDNVKGVFYREENGIRTYYIIPKNPINNQNSGSQSDREDYSITLTASDANIALPGVKNVKHFNLGLTPNSNENWAKTGKGIYSVTRTVSVEKNRIGALKFTMNVIDLTGYVPVETAITVRGNQNSVTSALPIAFNSNGECAVNVRIDRRQSSSKETLDMPEIEIVPNVEAVGHAYRNDNAKLFDAQLKNFKLDVYDQYNQNAAETASNAGIGTVTWTLNDSTGYVKNAEKTINAGVIEGSKLNEWQTEIHDSISVNRDGAGETNNAVITVSVTDNAGNQIGMQDFYFGLDTLAPRVAVTYNDRTAPVHNGKYFKETRVATVQVEDINFDPSNAALFAADTQVSGSAWSVSGNTFTRTFTYAADGDYTFAVETRDLAGNVRKDRDVTYSGAAPKEFTVDKTAPVITVVYNNNSVLNGRFYKNDRTATITILEHNFDRAIDLSTPITAELNGNSIAIPAVEPFSPDGDTHIAHVTFHNDGDYTLGVQYTDLAGNVAVPYEGSLFTIDQTKPVIEISGVENINVAAVSPVITYSDNNFDLNNYTAELLFSRMLKAPEAVDPGRREENKSGKGVTVIISDVSYEKISDGIYELTAKAIDLAGNEADIKTITYSVNRFGSTYYTEDPTTLSLLDGFSKEPLPLQVVEVNPNQLTKQSITLSVNGQTITLMENQDYAMSVDGNDATGYRYTYNIKASAFEEDGALREGAYVVTFFSEDAAGNANSNRSNATVEEDGSENLLDINFTLDNTDPLVRITGIENGERITADQRDVVVYFSDSSEVAKVVINVNGKEIVLEGDELAALNGQYTVHLTESADDQIISATVYDAAGNAIESGSYSVYLNSNILRQFVHNRGLFFGSLAGVLVAGTGGFFLLAKKKKKKDEDETK